MKDISLGNYQGDWALITGASSGIGREFCVQLAKKGMNLVMIARNRESLQMLADELVSRHGVKTLVAAVDLSDDDAVRTIKNLTEAENVKIRLLCNNAAFGYWGHFEDMPANFYKNMLKVNAAVIVELCLAFFDDLSGFDDAIILNVSSPAACQPIPYMQVYAAGKAFVDSFSIALHEEWKSHGILVQTLTPGPTETLFDERAGGRIKAFAKRASPADVVKIALANAGKADMPVIKAADGLFKQRLLYALLPTGLLVSKVAEMFKPPLRNEPKI
jgi:short-subunit dehydrogenase